MGSTKPNDAFMVNREEQNLVNMILTLFRFRDIHHCHVRNSGTIIHTPMGLRFGKNMFPQPGVPDILAWRNGRSIAIEVKSPGGRLRPEQAQWLDRFQREGGTALVARSLEDVQKLLKNMN